MRFTEKFNLNSHKQSDYEFVNIRIDTDNLLFIDPTRIANNNDKFSKECNVILRDFFESIFDLYVEGKKGEARQNFSNSGESNEIFFGYTNGFPRGNGNSEESLSSVFDYVHEHGLLSERIVGSLEDFHIFVPDFGEDLLSDLVASIIKKNLIEFTQIQCEKLDIPLDKKVTKAYWNHVEHKWNSLEALLPQVDGFPVVLVPKNIAVSNYLYTPNRYWTQVISEWRQKYHKENNTKLHRENAGKNRYVSKEKIKDVESEGLTEKEYLMQQTKKDISKIQVFRDNIQNTQQGSNNNQMNDKDLEKYILESYKREAKV